MTETRQTALFSLALLTLIAAAGALYVGYLNLDQYRTDNQTMAVLRAQNAELKRGLHDTEVALDAEAFKMAHLEDEVNLLRAEAEQAAALKKGRGRL